MINKDVQRYRPVVNNGHPDLSPDSISYQEYWEQERDRCINGYKPRGMDKISGKYYFYLNYFKILGNSGTVGNRKTLISPWYREMDKEYFETFETCKDEGKGMIVIKARDKGFSYMNSGLLGHEFTFFPFNDVGVAAGLQSSATSFFNKVKNGLNNIHPNFRHSALKDTDEIYKAGYKLKNKDGKWETGGYQSQIICRTMDNPEVFKGERLGVMVFEEAGEFKRLKNAYMSSKACFMDGDIQYGVPVIGGTGGDITKSSKDFMEMYYNADAFNLIPSFIPASRAYYGFYDIESGVEDEVGARKKLESDRKKVEADQKAYNLHLQNYPMTVEEAFLNTKSSRFNISLINQQRGKIMTDTKLKGQIQKGNLHWVSDDNGTLSVEFEPHQHGKFKILHHPRTNFVGLDIGGVDSYDQDQAGASTSEGCAMIYRRFYNIDEPGDMLVAEYTDRPERKEDFYDGVLKLAVYYNAKMLIEYTKIAIIDYFKKEGMQNLLKEKPASAHNIKTLTRNTYGVHMNKQVKSYMEDLMDDYIKSSINDIWFYDLLEELSLYGQRNTDRAIAFGLCLLHNNDNYRRKVLDAEEKISKESLGFRKFAMNSQGIPKKIR